MYKFASKALNFLFALVINYLFQFTAYVVLCKDSRNIEIDKLVEIIGNELYFAVVKGIMCRRLKSTSDTFYFSIDDELVYHNYYSDFGPLNISCLYKFCSKLNKLLSYLKGIKRIVHYTSSNEKKKANAAYLMASYAVLYLKMHPDVANKMLCAAGPFKNFVDASQYPSMYRLQIIDCLRALYKAAAFNFFNFADFNDIEYDTRNSLQYGDLNWLVPRKFLALIGPTENEFLNGHPPEFYIKYFLQNDVKTVIRLNNKFYDSNAFRRVGIEHYDLIFPDGSTPPKEILFKFLDIVENAPAVIAVHCKAGLGRTGSLIGAYLMKHYKLTAKESIAWMRICRPGSVIGQQQNWLEKLEKLMWNFGAEYRARLYGDPDKIPYHKYGIYSRRWPAEREKMIREARKKIQTKYLQQQQVEKNEKSMASDPIKNSVKFARKERRPIHQTHEKNTIKDILKLITRCYHGDKDESNEVQIKKGITSTRRCYSHRETRHVENPTQIHNSSLEFKTALDKNYKIGTQGDRLNNIKANREKIVKERNPEKTKLSVLYQNQSTL